jgi:hypothetical protein
MGDGPRGSEKKLEWKGTATRIPGMEGTRGSISEGMPRQLLDFRAASGAVLIKFSVSGDTGGGP